MSKREIDRNIRDILKKNVKKEIETEEGSVFSRKEVMRKVRDRIRWKGNSNEEPLAEMYSTGQISRRKFLKMLGLGAGGAVVATSGAGYFFGTKIFHETGMSPTGYATNVPDQLIQNAPGDNVVNVNSFEEACDQFTDGNTVVLAQGTYPYDEDGAEYYGGNKYNCSLIGDGEVILERPEITETVDPSDPGDVSEPLGPKIRPTLSGGNIRMQNLTVRNQMGRRQSRFARIEADEGQNIDLININMPDGTVNCSDAQFTFAGSDSNHAGTARIINCSIHDMGNTAIYHTYADGNTIVDSCYIQDVIHAFRPSVASGSVCRNTVWVWNESPPNFWSEGSGWGECGGNSARGIHTEESTPDLLIEDNDFWMQDIGDPGPCILIEGGASGTMRNITIRNDSSDAPISFDDADSWNAENICVYGDGDTDVPGEIEDAVTSSCDSVRTKAPINSNWASNQYGLNQNGVLESGSGGSGTSGGGGTSPTTSHQMTLSGGSSSNPLNYFFKAEGEITASSFPGNNAGVFTRQATGNLKGGTHQYEYMGSLTDFRADDGVSVSIDGTSYTPIEVINQFCR